MTEEEYAQRLEKAKSLADIDEIVKDAVRQVYKKSRPGMMLGLADLGEGANAWIGGYHVVSSNAIIMNSRPLNYVEEHHPEYYKPYAFSILLHEYIHTLGVLDEAETRGRTLEVSEKTFGNHLSNGICSGYNEISSLRSTGQIRLASFHRSIDLLCNGIR